MMENTKHRPLVIDLNHFKLHIELKKRIELTLYFNTPSRRFYLSVIAFVVNEMKRLGKITTIPLEGNHDLLVLLNDTVGGSAGSSEKDNLLPRIYRKWKNALPNLEEAPLFKVVGRKKEYDEGAGKAYTFTETEKDNWANLFEYTGSEENVRLKFAIDKIGARLDDVVIIYEDSVNGDAWGRFLSSLEKKVETVPETKPVQLVLEVPGPPVSIPRQQGTALQRRYRWIGLIAVIVMIVAAAAWAIWEFSLKPAQVKKALMKRMAFPLPDRPSIAVLPFVNMSDDRSQEIFTDGLTDDLITDLSKVSGLFVIARNSTFLYKGKSVKIQQVAEDLGVRYVLEGSVRREEDQVRINAQLVDATTGQHLWADRFDGNMGDVFSLQDKINQKIVAALAVKLTAGEKASVSQKGTNDPAAYEEVMKGHEHYRRLTDEDYVKAAACFKRALELDPNYSQAKAALAYTYFFGARFRMDPAFKLSNDELRLRARQYLVEAMQEPTSIAYQVAASMDLLLRQYDEAISSAEKALALEPNDSIAHSSMSWVLSMCGRPAEGLEYAKSGMRLDPLNPAAYLVRMGLAYLCMGRWQESAAVTEKALKLRPELRGLGVSVLSSAYAHLGRYEEARVALETYSAKNSTSFGPPEPLMYALPFKDRETAESFVENLNKAGLIKPGPEYIHVSREDQITGKDLKAFYYPSKITGYSADGSQWSQEFAENGTVTFRAPGLPGEVDTGKSWLQGDRIWLQFQNYMPGMPYCRTTFKNPKGTPEKKNEYVSFSDVQLIKFSRTQ